MNIIEEVYRELAKLGLSNTDHIDLEEIQNKDGIYLFRIKYENRYYVLKYFLNDEYTREIKNYSILEKLDIPTIKVYAHTDRALLLEDLKRSKKYRLGKESDLMDTEVAKVLAAWYVDLHDKGVKYVYENGDNLYREIDVVTRENINFIKNKSDARHSKVWDLILDNYDLTFSKIDSLQETLTYNDFYWTNLAVKKDRKEAIMFDYNLLGVGFRYNDIRNVYSSLSEEAGEVFIEEYGAINEEEKIIDEGISPLITLIFAYRRPRFPNWAQDSLDTIHSGELEKAIKRIIDL